MKDLRLASVQSPLKNYFLAIWVKTYAKAGSKVFWSIQIFCFIFLPFAKYYVGKYFVYTDLRFSKINE